MSMSRLMQEVVRERDGTTAMEFGIISIPLIFLLCGTLDVAYQSYVASVVQGTTYAAARKIVLEDATDSAVETYARGQLASIAKDDKVTITTSNFLSYSKVGKPEKLTTDVNGNKIYDKNGPDCFVDDNNNNVWDSVSEGESGHGGAEDVVSYKIAVQYTRLTPVAAVMGMSNVVNLSRTTFLRNEPYAGIIDPVTKCGV